MAVVAPLSRQRENAGEGKPESTAAPVSAPALASAEARELATALSWRNLLTFWMLAAPAEWS
jgi:hypothetical protein